MNPVLNPVAQFIFFRSMFCGFLQYFIICIWIKFYSFYSFLLFTLFPQTFFFLFRFVVLTLISIIMLNRSSVSGADSDSLALFLDLGGRGLISLKFIRDFS